MMSLDVHRSPWVDRISQLNCLVASVTQRDADRYPPSVQHLVVRDHSDVPAPGDMGGPSRDHSGSSRVAADDCVGELSVGDTV